MENGTKREGLGKLSVSSSLQSEQPLPPSKLWKIIIVASIAAGVQFGWALQLSLLTPYVQLLGIAHKYASFIWLCGPISGMIVQPVVGYYSDNCTSRFGRRRPFIAAGAALVAIAVFLIGFAADLGHASGDTLGKGFKPRAIAVFVVGFWILDVANNMLQGPCRALLADLSGGKSGRMRTANAFFSFFMAVGNILGYAAGSYSHLFKVFPFSKTPACDVYCANLKSCFFIAIFLLLSLTTLALTLVRENDLPEKEEQEIDEKLAGAGKSKVPFFGEIFGALKDLPRPMWILLLVTCLNWIAWFPFFLYDTDWMAREVFGGKVGDSRLYDLGVRYGALGLLLQSVVLGFMSLGVEFLGKKIGGAKRLWGILNFVLAICLAMTILVTKMAEKSRHNHANGTLMGPTPGVKIGALLLFAALGIPLAVTFSIPFALASIFSSNAGSGQGLSCSGPESAYLGRFDGNSATVTSTMQPNPQNPVESHTSRDVSFKAMDQQNELSIKSIATPIPLQAGMTMPVPNNSAFSEPPPRPVSNQCPSTNDSLNHHEDEAIDGGRISISSPYSQRLLTSLSQALQSTDLDLSEATISVQIDFGKRAKQAMTSGPSLAKDNDNPTLSGNQHTDHFGEATNDEDLDQAQKRLKI